MVLKFFLRFEWPIAPGGNLGGRMMSHCVIVTRGCGSPKAVVP